MSVVEKFFLTKNVSYISGIPKSISNIEKVYQFILPSPLLSQTATAGQIATSASLDITTRVDSWARWTAVFKQYCITKVQIASRVAKLDYAGSPQGEVFIRLEEDNAVPTGSIVRAEHAVLNLADFQNSSDVSCTSVWKPTSAEDLQWVNCSAGANPSYLKVYMDPTNTLSSAGDSTTRICHLMYFHVAFRYLAS